MPGDVLHGWFPPGLEPVAWCYLMLWYRCSLRASTGSQESTALLELTYRFLAYWKQLWTEPSWSSNSKLPSGFSALMTALLIMSILELFVLISIVSNLLLLIASWVKLTYGVPENVDNPMIFLKEDFYISVVTFIVWSFLTMTQTSPNLQVIAIVRSLFLSKKGLLPIWLISELEKRYESPYVLNLTIVLWCLL